jgi:hypothetical protein
VTPEEVAEYVESLPLVKRKGTESRPAWYVHNRLVVRLQDPKTLVIRVPLSERESLLETYPDSFGVPPRMDAHHKVEAYLDDAQPIRHFHQDETTIGRDAVLVKVNRACARLGR